MTTNRSAPSGSVVPVLIYKDVPQAIRWLCDVFGFSERLRAGEGHAQLAIGKGSVMLGAARFGQGFDSPDSAEFRQPAPDVVSHYIHVQVDDVDRHFAHARQRGALILQPPTTYPFGERQYKAQDLGGHRWTFSQSIADVDPAEWGSTVATNR